MEEDIFLKKMKGVKALKKDQEITETKYIDKKKHIKTKIKTEINNNINVKVNKIIKKNTEYNLSFGEFNKELKRGKVKIDRKLDLHGYGLFEAHKKFKNEVKTNYYKGKRCLLVITGKGINKKVKNDDNIAPKLFYGKIKNSIIEWINEDDIKRYILTYQDAGIENGGDGAIFVYLRKNKF